MSLFQSKQFFDLEQFEHASLFQPQEELWNVLKNISNYLSSMQLGSIDGAIESGAFLINPEEISIGTGSKVESGAYIIGPCIIGKNCQIRHGAYIRGNVITGNDCIIGHSTEVKNSIFLNQANAAHFAYVGDSIVGNQVNLGAGVKCANLRCDREPVTIEYDRRKISTKLHKFGAIIGDKVQIGCNAVTNPGTIISKGCVCYPTMSIHGFIPENSIVKPSQRNMAFLQRQSVL